jgi:hypothetical protein
MIMTMNRSWIARMVDIKLYKVMADRYQYKVKRKNESCLSLLGRTESRKSFFLFNLQDHQTHLQRHSISIYLPKIQEPCLLIQSRFVCVRIPRFIYVRSKMIPGEYEKVDIRFCSSPAALA